MSIFDRLFRKNSRKNFCEEYEKNVLVGTLRRPEQLDCCIIDNFYHIPQKRLPMDADKIKYIAIYQSQWSFSEKSGIYYYGEVESYSFVSRNQIREIQKDSDEIYCYFKIKNYQKLDNPITLDGENIYFITTNIDLLCDSTYLSELKCENRKEKDLLSVLIKAEKENSTVKYNGLDIIFGKETISLYKNDREIGNVSIEKYTSNRYSAAKRLLYLIMLYGK